MILPVVENPMRKGWCPGARRPMESGDGLLMRVRPHGGRLDGVSLTLLGELAARWGNGSLELTRRANLQLRGIHPQDLSSCHEALADAGLIDADAITESVRNILLSPLAGLDRTASFDGRAVLGSLEDGLAGDAALHALPAKFSFLIDEGGRLPLADIAADIRLTAAGSHVLLSVGGDARSAQPVAMVDAQDAAATALQLARAFLRLGRGLRRMAELVEAHGVKTLRILTGLAHEACPPDAAPSLRVRSSDIIGPQAGFFGVGAPFGALTSGQIAGLSALVAGEVRLTPWRALLLPGVGTEASERLAALGFVVDPSDPRLRVAACPGAPACSSGEAPTRLPAATLAPLVAAMPGDGIALHLSGCAKGCAMSEPAPFVAIGRNGGYDLVLDGRTADVPARKGLSLSGLGKAILEGRGMA